MAANRRRLLHRLQAGDPLDLPASGAIIPLEGQGLPRLGRPDIGPMARKLGVDDQEVEPREIRQATLVDFGRLGDHGWLVRGGQERGRRGRSSGRATM
jgi:hypothetical protein